MRCPHNALVPDVSLLCFLVHVHHQRLLLRINHHHAFHGNGVPRKHLLILLKLIEVHWCCFWRFWLHVRCVGHNQGAVRLQVHLNRPGWFGHGMHVQWHGRHGCAMLHGVQHGELLSGLLLVLCYKLLLVMVVHVRHHQLRFSRQLGQGILWQLFWLFGCMLLRQRFWCFVGGMIRIVDFHVSLDMGASFEPFPTLLTHMWPLTSVRVSVISQALPCVTTIATDVTNKVTDVVRVVHEVVMTPQALTELKLLSAHITRELLYVRMCAHVVLQV